MTRPATWPSVGVQTAAQLQRKHRRADRHQLSVARVLDAMKRGAVLRLSYENGRALWSLSSGPFVAADVAASVITKSCVASVGDALFVGMPGQTWRFVESKEDSR
jgi:hypothetical protein